MVDNLNKHEKQLQGPRFIHPWGWYVATTGPHSQVSGSGGYKVSDYLHRDLNIHISTQEDNQSGGGYFDTEEDAEKAIADYRQKWNSPTAKQMVNHKDAFDRAMKGI